MHTRLFYKFILCSLFLAPAGCLGQSPDTVLIHFDFNRSLLTPHSDSLIDGYFARAKGSSSIEKISLQGFCDSIGAGPYNDSLSKERVMSVRNYLLTRCADTGSIRDLRWFGKRYPLNDNVTAADRAANRRVLIIISRSVSMSPPAATTDSPTVDSRSITDAIRSTRAGTSIVLKDVVFFGDRHIPLTSSFVVLDELKRALTDNPLLRIRIEGHVCCLPDSLDGTDFDSGKKDLSLERAKYVYDYLRKAGISKDRMSYVGYGAANKLFPDESSPDRQAQNRRVEIRVISK